MTSNDETPMTLLLADDDDDLRELLAEVLAEELDYRVVQARNGTEALDQLRRHAVALLLLDQRMPELTGAEVLQRMRSEGISVPVVLMTAAREIAALASALDVDGYLAKPFSIDELVSCVGRTLQQRAQG